MRYVAPQKRIRIGSLHELDALIGTRVTGERPVSRWENRVTQFVFASVEEALDALSDPYYGSFMPSGGAVVLTEVKEYRRYSSDLNAAWDVVQTVSRPDEPLRVCVAGECWAATFGERPTVIAPTAPVAICVAALHAKGVAVELAPEVVKASGV